jgi:hypothetical protein
MVLKVLNSPFVFLRGSFCFEGAEVSSLAGFWILLPRIEPVFATF